MLPRPHSAGGPQIEGYVTTVAEVKCPNNTIYVRMESRSAWLQKSALIPFMGDGVMVPGFFSSSDVIRYPLAALVHHGLFVFRSCAVSAK